jgi:hypothetical protein
MMNDPKYERDSSPYHEYFKLPLVLANFTAFAFKWCFAAAGAIAFTEETNLFAGLLFSKRPNDAVLGVLAVFAVLIVLPNAIHLQRQAKYFATLSSEDSIPCNQYLVGILLPWVMAAVLCHLQIYAQLINFTSLVCCANVAIVCSFLMWTTQLEESMVHQTNFKESITMLVVQDQDASDESGGDMNDEQNRVNEVRLKRREAARPRNAEKD